MASLLGLVHPGFSVTPWDAGAGARLPCLARPGCWPLSRWSTGFGVHLATACAKNRSCCWSSPSRRTMPAYIGAAMVRFRREWSDRSQKRPGDGSSRRLAQYPSCSQSPGREFLHPAECCEATDLTSSPAGVREVADPSPLPVAGASTLPRRRAFPITLSPRARGCPDLGMARTQF